MKLNFKYIAAVVLVALVFVVISTNAKRQARVPVCHKGSVMMVSAASYAAHIAHGDYPAVVNADGTLSCPRPCEDLPGTIDCDCIDAAGTFRPCPPPCTDPTNPDC